MFSLGVTFNFAMSENRKRGPYFKYLRDRDSSKIPRQTIFNQRERELNINNRMEREPVENNNDNQSEQLLDDENETFLESDSADSDVEDEDINVEERESIFDREFYTPLSEHLNCTVADAMFMIYAFSVRHNLNWKAVQNLVCLVNMILGDDVLKPSKYEFKKKFGMRKNIIRTTHFTCDKCHIHLGTEDDLKRSNLKKCVSCNTDICTDIKYKKSHFFTIPIKSQIQTLLEQNSEHFDLTRVRTTDFICDIHDSLNYTRLIKNMGNTPFITLTVSLDGAAVFISTKDKSFWPIQFFINEIDIANRFKRKNILCAAFSFGKTPDMQVFLRPFVEEINEINNEGGLVFLKNDGTVCKVKVFPIIFTADAPAKSDVLNKVHHSGRGGCPYCEHNGTVLDGTTQVLYCNKDNARLRSNTEARANMIEAHLSGQRVNGYHGLSALAAFKHHFDVISQVVIDRMHCVDCGVIKRLFNLFLSSKNRGHE